MEYFSNFTNNTITNKNDEEDEEPNQEAASELDPVKPVPRANSEIHRSGNLSHLLNTGYSTPYNTGSSLKATH